MGDPQNHGFRIIWGYHHFRKLSCHQSIVLKIYTVYIYIDCKDSQFYGVMTIEHINLYHVSTLAHIYIYIYILNIYIYIHPLPRKKKLSLLRLVYLYILGHLWPDKMDNWESKGREFNRIQFKMNHVVFTNGGFLKWDGVPQIIQNETILVLKPLLLAIPYFKKSLAPKNHKSCVILVRLPRSFQQRWFICNRYSGPR